MLGTHLYPQGTGGSQGDPISELCSRTTVSKHPSLALEGDKATGLGLVGGVGEDWGWMRNSDWGRWVESYGKVNRKRQQGLYSSAGGSHKQGYLH